MCNFEEHMRRWWKCERCARFNEIDLYHYLTYRRFKCPVCSTIRELGIKDLYTKEEMEEGKNAKKSN